MISGSSGTLPQPDQPCIALAVNLVEEDSISLEAILRGSTWILKEVQTCQEALDLSRDGTVPVVLCDTRMPDGNWNVLMDKLRQLPDPPAVTVVSRLADEHLWLEVLSLGGHDVLVTPLDRREVLRVLFLAWRPAGRKRSARPAGLKIPAAIEKTAERTLKRLCASSAS